MAKTSKTISTISYNTKKFLIDKLETLIYQRVITYYEFITHLPDEDDRKQHIHLFIMPNENLDLAKFKDSFDEYSSLFDKTITLKIRSLKLSSIKKIVKYDYPILKLYGRQSYKNKKKFKPLGCMPFRITHKFGDWYWYVLHNKDYLRAKELTRNITYCDEDIFSQDLDFHNQLVFENKLEDFCTMGDVSLFKFCFKGLQENKSLSDLLSTGYVPLNKVTQFKTLYNSLVVNNTENTLKNNDSKQLYNGIDLFKLNLYRQGIEETDLDPVFD